VISGFIMATIGPGQKASQFIINRAWRIYPMWFMAVLPWLIVFPHATGTILTSLTLWPIWNGTFYMPAPLLGWTLCFEVLFYASFTLALASRAIVPLSIFVVCFTVGPANAVLAYFGSPLILEFLLGVATARLPRVPGGGLLMLAAIVWFAVAPADYFEFFWGYDALIRVLTWGLPAAMLVYGAVSSDEHFRHRAADVAVLIGNASFSIYLFHRLVVRGQLPWWLEILFGIALGVIVHLLVERRILRLRPRHSVHLAGQDADLPGSTKISAASR